MLDTPAPPADLAPDAALDVEQTSAPEQQEEQQPAPRQGGRPPVNTTTAVLAAALSSSAAAWMVGGLFRDFSAHLVALLGVLVGAGFLLLASRGGRLGLLQYLVAPAAILLGVVLVAGDMAGKTVLDLVREAVRNGGLLQPPASFDPGWRPLLVILFALVSAAAAGVAAGLRRPKLGVAVPAPLLIGASIIEPPGSEIASAAIALVLIVLGLTLAFGAELGADGQVSASFEMPRLLRAGAIAGMLAVGVTVVSSFGFLFPQPNQQHTVPPQKPQQPPPEADRPLFDVTMARSIPLRLGVLDTYDAAQQAWMLPGYDAARVKRIKPPANLPDAPSNLLPKVTVSVTVAGADGHALPSIAGLQKLAGTSDTIAYDPETQAITVADRPVYKGMSYTVTGASLDEITAKQLDAAAKPGKTMAPYLAAPTPPNQVVALLTSCAQQMAKSGSTALFERLQCVRKGFYDKVVAAGTGPPVDVSPARVGRMLDGGDATPYEITAAEALLARWAGVPSRIGYGYYVQQPSKDGHYQIRPVNGAMWTEVNFAGYGWVPIIGVPPKAKPSTSTANMNNTNARPPDKAQMMIYIPVRRPTALLLFEYTRYWVLQVLPVVLLVVVLGFAHPWFFKLARRRRRRRWAARNGLEGRIAAAYCEFRDRARDLTVGDPGATPLKFLAFVEPDTEHRELAWLVTRGLWGDLRRDLRVADAEAAEAMARSVARRLDRAQPVLNRVVARVARTSLRAPYSDQLPNAWYERQSRVHPLRRIRNVLRDLRRTRRRRPAFAAAASALTVLLLLTSCGQAVQAAPRHLDTRLVPAQLGDYSFTREKGGESQFAKAGPDALVSAGLLYTVHAHNGTFGSVEVTVFKPDVDVEDINDESMTGHCVDTPNDCPGHEILRGFQSNLGGGHFHRLYYRGQRAYVTDLPDQRVYVWFPRGKESMVILDLIRQFTESSAADDMFHALVDVEQGRTPGQVQVPVIKPAATPTPGANP
jgi:hypothetical protein